jgi:transposase
MAVMALTVTVDVPQRDRKVLASWLRSTSIRAGLAQRARIVLLAGEGLGTGEIVARTGLSKPTVIAWKRRYASEGLGGLDDRRRQLHIVLDNYGTHKHPEVRSWLARNPRVILHFTPTSGSWLNIVEIFFGIITRQTIRRGTFTSVKDLTAAIGTFIDGWNDRCEPFTWTKTADELLPHCKPSKRTSLTAH